MSQKLCQFKKLAYLCTTKTRGPGGGMVDARVSGARAERRAGSSPVLGTHKSRNSLKIKSCGIFHSIFVSKLSAKV